MGGLSTITDPFYTLYPEPLQKDEDFVRFANTIDIFKNIFLKEVKSIHTTYNFKISDKNILKNLCDFLAVDYTLEDNEENLRRKLMLAGFYYKKNYSTVYFLKEEIKKIIGYYPKILENYGFYNQYFLQFDDGSSFIKNFILWDQIGTENFFVWVQSFGFNLPLIIDLLQNFSSEILDKIYKLIAKYKSASAKISVGYTTDNLVIPTNKIFSQNSNHTLSETFVWNQLDNLFYFVFVQYFSPPSPYITLKIIYSTDLTQDSERNVPKNFFYQF